MTKNLDPNEKAGDRCTNRDRGSELTNRIANERKGSPKQHSYRQAKMNLVAGTVLIRKLYTEHLRDQCSLAVLKDITVLIIQPLQHKFNCEDDTREL